MAKKEVNTELPINNSGVAPHEDSLLNQDHIEYDPIKIYSERADYSKTSKVSEVFGPKNHSKISALITQYTKMYDDMLASGQKGAAGIFESGIKKVYKQLQHLSDLKDEWMMMRGGGMRGKSTVSNITDPRWPDLFFTEKGDIHITPDYQVLGHVPTLAAPPKVVNEIAIDWESKGDGEGRYMAGIQDMQEAGVRGDKNPPFNVDYFVSNLLEEYWPQALSDKWGGVYALHNILPEMVKNNGGNSDGLDLSIEAFNPIRDAKLHNYYAKRLKSAFDPDYESETNNDNGASQLMAKLTSSDKLSHKTKGVIKKERETHGKI